MIKSRFDKCRVFYDDCPECGNEIKGCSEDACLNNLGIHRFFRHGVEIKHKIKVKEKKP